MTSILDSTLNTTTTTNDIKSKDLIANRYKKSRYSMPGDWVEFSYCDEDSNNNNTQQYEDINEVFAKHYLWKASSSSQEKITELKKNIELTNHNENNNIHSIKDNTLGIHHHHHHHHKEIKKEEGEEEEKVNAKMDLSSLSPSLPSNSGCIEKKRKLTDVNHKVILENNDNQDQCDNENGMNDEINNGDIKKKKNEDEDKKVINDDHKRSDEEKEKMVIDINKPINVDIKPEDNTNKIDDDFDVIEDINTGNTTTTTTTTTTTITTTSIESNQNIEIDDDWEML